MIRPVLLASNLKPFGIWSLCRHQIALGMGAWCLQPLPGSELEIAARAGSIELDTDLLARIRRLDDAYIAERQRLQK